MSWKNGLFLVAALVLVGASAHATISLVSPVPASLQPNASFSLGEAMPGETFELAFSNEDGKGGYWNAAEVVSSSIPASWKVTPAELFAESLVLSIRIPKDETEKIQTIRVRLSDVRDSLHSQEASLKLVVKNDLLKTSFSPLQESILLGQNALYRVVLVNNSIAPHAVAIHSSLPNFWFEPQTISLSPSSAPSAIQELVLELDPKSYGQRNFSFFVDSELSGKRLASFQTGLLVKPTIEGKFQAGLFGYSFFSPDLSVFYFFNALLGSLQ